MSPSPSVIAITPDTVTLEPVGTLVLKIVVLKAPEANENGIDWDSGLVNVRLPVPRLRPVSVPSIAMMSGVVAVKPDADIVKVNTLPLHGPSPLLEQVIVEFVTLATFPATSVFKKRANGEATAAFTVKVSMVAPEAATAVRIAPRMSVVFKASLRV
ncbi:MAG: hypothetical protein ABI824_01925 [Acidobacteriota bacterium]